ncbi:MAG: hypothetical protein ACYDD2_04245 [Candidatus Acidiferrales bacterium]
MAIPTASFVALRFFPGVGAPPGAVSLWFAPQYGQTSLAELIGWSQCWQTYMVSYRYGGFSLQSHGATRRHSSPRVSKAAGAY